MISGIVSIVLLAVVLRDICIFLCFMKECVASVPIYINLVYVCLYVHWCVLCKCLYIASVCVKKSVTRWVNMLPFMCVSVSISYLCVYPGKDGQPASGLWVTWSTKREGRFKMEQLAAFWVAVQELSHWLVFKFGVRLAYFSWQIWSFLEESYPTDRQSPKPL